MKIVPASLMMIPRDERRGNIAAIEQAARTCYKSEDKITEDSADKLVRMLIRNNHEAMLEHGDYIFRTTDHHVYANVEGDLSLFEMVTGNRLRIHLSADAKDRFVISGNIRAWRDFIRSRLPSAWYFIPLLDPIYIEDLDLKEWVGYSKAGNVEQMFYSELESPTEKLTHLQQTVKFTVDRGVTHEFVRHRDFSFAQESTRYCNYSKGKFGSEITVIEPLFFPRGTQGFDMWKQKCETAERDYFDLLNYGASPQEARTVLPTSTKADLVVTGCLREWRHFFNLRALDRTGAAHPQAKEVALPTYEIFKVLFPDVID